LGSVLYRRSESVTIMELILISGATGKIGGAVATQLLSRGVPVRALVRSDDARAERLRCAGAEVVVGDMFDFDSLAAALRGTTRAFYCPPMDPHMIQSATTFALAASDAGIRSIVSLSQWLANPPSPALLTRQHWLIDRLFSQIPDITLTIVNPGFFADNVLSNMVAIAAHLGRYPWPYGDSLNAWPSNEDIARVAVAALIDPERHDRHVYRPTGPALLSGQDIADTLARVLGRRVKLMQMPDWMFAKAVRAAGFPPFMQLQMRTYNQEQRRGAFAYNAPTDHVLRATGHQPESFETTVQRYAALPAAQQSFENRFSAVAQLVKILVTPALDVDRFERRTLLPTPVSARLSIDDEGWLREHRPGPDVPRIDARRDVRIRGSLDVNRIIAGL
jgi:NAD(P)H dehydrogenase (quinone)